VSGKLRAIGPHVTFTEVLYCRDVNTVSMSHGASYWAVTECHSRAALDIDLPLDLPRGLDT